MEEKKILINEVCKMLKATDDKELIELIYLLLLKEKFQK